MTRTDEFRKAYTKEKTKFDIKYRLEELKKDIHTRSPGELIVKVEDLERFMGV